MTIQSSTWLFLILLTLAAYLLRAREAAPAIILMLGGLKFSLVAWVFMDLRQAAAPWQVAMAGLLALILGVTLCLA
jgi:hypothetical protein